MLVGMLENRTFAQQTGVPRFSETSETFAGGGLFGVSSQKLTYLDPKGSPLTPGKNLAETLRGNGTRAGYVLSHGGIVPSSVQVSVGARTLRPDEDYYLDAANGSLGFAQPVRVNETIRVIYRYVEGQDGARSPVGVSGVSLKFNGTSLNFGYGVSSSKGLDFNTYGLALHAAPGKSLRPGQASTTWDSLVYFSTPSASNGNRLQETTASITPLATPDKKTRQEAVSDRLLVQNVQTKSGKTGFRATFQDIGQNFTGFQAMKQSSTGDAARLAQIAALEKEAGVKRLGFGTDSALSRNGSFQFDWDQIKDGKDAIQKQALGFKADRFRFGYSTQSTGEKFTRFNDLREAEKAQWGREKGTTRQEMTLGFALGTAAAGKTAPGGFGFSQSLFGDKTGSLTRRAFDFSDHGLQFSRSERAADAKFTRLNDLTDAEKTALALDIRRQFNPNAKPEEVTAAEKAQVIRDAGLTRKRDLFSLAPNSLLGKQSSLTFQQFTVVDDKGQIARQSLQYTTKGVAFNYLDQRIGDKFGHLTGLSDYEKAQLGNELGMHRTSIGLNLTLSKTSTLTFADTSVGDTAGRMSRQNIAYTAKGLELKYAAADTDKAFVRAKDLAQTADPEKALIESERGFRRTDFAANYTALRGLAMTAFLSDALNPTDKQARSSYKDTLLWTPTKTTKWSFLREGSRFAQAGDVRESREHELFTYDTVPIKGAKFNFFRDALTTVSAGKAVPTVTTDFLHFESDRAKPLNWLAETKRVDYGNQKFEDTTQYDVNFRASKTLAFHLNTVAVDRGKDPSTDTKLLGWNWQTTKTLNFSGSFAETKTNNGADVTAKTFALAGPLTKTLDIKGTYAEIDQHKKDVKAVSDVAISNAKPLNVAGLKKVVLTAHYAATNDQKKQQSELMAGKIQGMLGNHAFTAEYGGSLDVKGVSAVARTYSFTSDRNEKLPFHCDVFYKSRNINRGSLLLVRKYNAAWKVGKKAQLTYNYTALPEDAAGNPQPLKSSTFALKQSLNKTMSLTVDRTTALNETNKTATDKLGVTLGGKLDKVNTLAMGYSVDINIQGATRTDSQTCKLNYDCQLSGDRYLSLSATYILYAGTTPDAMQANIDFKTRF